MSNQPSDIIYFALGVINIVLSGFAVYSWTLVIILSNKFKNHKDRKLVDRLALVVSCLDFALYVWTVADNIPELYSTAALPDTIFFGRIVRTVSLVAWIVMSLYHMKIKPEDILK
jgi:hypothetical protein